MVEINCFGVVHLMIQVQDVIVQLSQDHKSDRNWNYLALSLKPK